MPDAAWRCAAKARRRTRNAAFDDAAEHIAKRLRRYRRRVNEHARDARQSRAPGDRRDTYVLRQESESADRDESATAVAALCDVVAEARTEIDRFRSVRR